MSKKGDLSMNTIIVAALALIVLVVMAAIFVSRMNTTNKTTGDNVDVAMSNVCLQAWADGKETRCLDACTSASGYPVTRPEPGNGWMDCNAECCHVR